jgi:putative Mg2+ transporter-C (MgtC) family protein
MDTVTVPASWSDLAIRLALAVAFGAIVGLDRELRRKPAGLRTHALIAMGAALVMMASLLVRGETADASAPSRVLQGLLAGIGFLGGGVIIRRQDPKGVHNLTTAASMWLVAGIGVCTGLGLWRTAATAVALSVVVLVAGAWVDTALGSRDV